jgi:hypothetical protein
MWLGVRPVEQVRVIVQMTKGQCCLASLVVYGYLAISVYQLIVDSLGPNLTLAGLYGAIAPLAIFGVRSFWDRGGPTAPTAVVRSGDGLE